MHEPTSASSIDVLYVDDDDAFAADAAEQLERVDNGLSIQRVTTAADALDRLDRASVDCVLSAHRLPDIDGIEFARTVRDAHGDLPFLLYTEAFDAVASDALAAGITDCVRKGTGTTQYELLAHRIRDAVTKRRVERTLRTERSQYHQLFEDAPVMYVVFRSVDDEPIIEDCNDRFLDRLGYDRDELLGRSVWELYADESMDRAVEGFDSGREGTFGQQERTLVAADGEHIETLFRASPRIDEHGTVIGTIGLYVDITERKHRERTLERLHETTRDLLRAESRTEVAEVITAAVRDVLGYQTNLVRLVDEEGTELHPVAITSSAERMLGERPVYAVGEGTAGRAFAEGETNIYADVQEVDDGYDRQDARASMFVPIGDHGVLSIGDTDVGAFDRSDRHLAEVFAANAATALTLLERTRDLERQNERLEAFASVVSHDLRTPLTVVDGSLELARERYDDADLDRAARSLDRAFDLIEDLLTLARQGDALDPDTVDLAAVAEACWQTVETGDATLVVEVDRPIRADESRLRQLLENLFRNAVDHGGEASADPLTVTLDRLDDESGFYVADDGPGLPDDRSDVFEAGYTTGSGGTGLGLAIVERIAAEHGWSVTARDAEDGGARFEFVGVETL
ncbi:receiver/sensor box histidine kinase [Haloplanus aerogenes]|uniref:histidine kinase n=1 Tax=Haloplanus aerogenes TaxID=660522 RepID=A0A3M0DRR3_9EURY|nr:ATP-binding protein [Haloplanus aerogenes]AZH24238.1 PAS domain S-box protein [Haloplanus aerogenes]RMB24134.1 PAS domain S-box-containing protein [Haloplanus aerogenes]